MIYLEEQFEQGGLKATINHISTQIKHLTFLCDKNKIVIDKLHSQNNGVSARRCVRKTRCVLQLSTQKLDNVGSIYPFIVINFSFK
jgi:hypothetical protein